MNRTLDNSDISFLVVGAAKSGTTWLHDMLSQHPQVFLPALKELHYFNRQFMENPSLENYNYDKPVTWYLNFFKGAKQGQLLGEVCPAYIWDAQAPQRIYAFNPQVKIIVMVRQPVERLFSEYLFFEQRGVLEQDTLAEVLEARPEFIARSMFHQQLSRFTALFPAEQIKVVLYDDLVADNCKLLLEVEEFLGLDPFIPETIDQRSNVTGVPRSKGFNRFVYRARTFLRKKRLNFVLDILRASGIAFALEQWRNLATVPYQQKPGIDPETKQKLDQIFKQDIEVLEKMLGRDLSAWKNR